MHWTQITPLVASQMSAEALGEVERPLNEQGEPCPWPWEPEQLVGAPLGMYHCGYCGAMVMAGLPHVDYKDIP